jgi:hypothetical protein
MTLTIAAQTRVVLSRETVRRELHTKAYVWKRARLRANDGANWRLFVKQ